MALTDVVAEGVDTVKWLAEAVPTIAVCVYPIREIVRRTRRMSGTATP